MTDDPVSASSSTTHTPLPPVVKRLTVRWDPATAIDRWTSGFGAWWPLRTHSVGGKQAERCVFENRVGGRIYEVVGTQEHDWGRVERWEPPTAVAFMWHPGRAADTAQRIEVRFEPVPAGTRVTLTHRGWETWGDKAPFLREGYDLGWEVVLAHFRGLGTPRRVTGVVRLVPRFASLWWRSRAARRALAAEDHANAGNAAT